MLQKTLFNTLLLLGLLACSSNGGNPTDPFFDPVNEYGGSIPPNATVISNEAFKQLAQQEGFKWDSLAIQADLAAQRQARLAADQAAVGQLIQQDPGYAYLLAPASPGVQVMADGSYLLEVQGKNGTFEVATQGPAGQMRSALESKARYETAANQLAVYTSGWEALEAAQRTGLPTPQSLANASYTTIRQARAALEEHLAANPDMLNDARVLPGTHIPTSAPNPGARPPGYPSSPSQEEGAGEGLDRSNKGLGCSHDSFNSDGLWANFWWRQKFYHTSIKTQWVRSICTAFALTAALEARIAIEQGRWVNLSEQFMWGKIASDWDERVIGEEASLTDMADDFHDSSWRLSFESAWNYNSSRFRQLVSFSPRPMDVYYEESCTQYSEFCSDISHQLEQNCTLVDGRNYCAYSMPSPSSERFALSEPDVIYDEWDIGSIPVNEMRLALIAGHPMVANLMNSADLLDPPIDNYITSAAEGSGYGSRDVVISGYISQADVIQHPTLPQNVKAYAQNSGGGFFILKNSWGTCYGDSGYIYVTTNWARENFRSVMIFDSNPSSQFKGAPPNIPPTLSIIAPNGGISGYQYPFRQPQTFTAQVDDPDTTLTPTVTWSSDKDGLMGTGTSIQFAFTTPGTRVITAVAADNQNAYASDTISITGYNLNPTAQIITPLPGATIYANDTQVQFLGKGSDGDGVFPVDLPCSSLAWSSSNAADNPLGTGCSFSKVFTSTGSRTITLTATDAYGAKGTATVVVNVTPKPASGPPVVNITSPADGDKFDATDNIRLSYTMSDPGGTPTSTYTVLWKLRVGNGAEKVITPKSCVIGGIPFACFKPSEYGITNNGVSIATLSLRVTDPESLSGTDQVTLQIGQVQ